MYELIKSICYVFQELADLVWGFPTNIKWYAGLPIIGELPLVIILLVGTGIYFTCSLRFVQIKYFRYGLNVLINSQKEKQGISPLASFLLSTAMRVGPGNILGVTGAVSTGGPGALFWMWLSAFFGMATAFVESTLSQIYKDRQGDEYVGGLPCYGRKILGGAAMIGGILSMLYIVYALLCIPAQGFNTISAMVAVTNNVTGTTVAADSAPVWGFFLLLMGVTAFSIFGGIRRITGITDVLVPIMAVVYVAAVLVMTAMNLELLPWFFYVVVTEAFRPEPIFGGAMGIALSQGIKRGLMSNEAGQGTLSMPAAVSYSKHPCDQGIVQAIGVFLDTMVICTLTGFVLIMGQAWLKDGSAAWFEMGRLEKFLASCAQMLGSEAGYGLVTLVISICFGIFAFTCLLGFLSFSEICARQISNNKVFIVALRLVNLAVLAFGMMTNIAGFDLSALWNLSDFANIVMVCCNLPLLYLGVGKVKKAFNHFECQEDKFCSETLGESLPVWDESK
ncbi:MAG: alanine:cation symporter family protein [Schwartzia succinivorans]|jgi:AGCS family alanine or glycine:cation symporter|uniref:alanine/glycine:cation symporter family protein n=1 Tax=Schwartzia succinivorans TaxID=55507 RepID=UPI002355D12F|nr:amino acid carrier protein [Schwartzia succinivorans]MBE6096914.1 alanine:cation symporter family protein [Schwartzia succinivorans]